MQIDALWDSGNETPETVSLKNYNEFSLTVPMAKF